MGYPRDLQDYEDQELVRELERRTENRHKGLCDYCGHGPGHPTCRYPDRHFWRETPNPDSREPLTFAMLRVANASRAKRWHPGFPGQEELPPEQRWGGSDWSNAMAGEAGEACNVVKKLRRAELGLRGVSDAPPAELVDRLALEIADTITYADLLAEYYGINLEAAIATKFNQVSELQGFPERLPAPARAREETFGTCPVCQQPADGHGH